MCGLSALCSSLNAKGKNNNRRLWKGTISRNDGPNRNRNPNPNPNLMPDSSLSPCEKNVKKHARF